MVLGLVLLLCAAVEGAPHSSVNQIGQEGLVDQVDAEKELQNLLADVEAFPAAMERERGNCCGRYALGNITAFWQERQEENVLPAGCTSVGGLRRESDLQINGSSTLWREVYSAYLYKDSQICLKCVHFIITCTYEHTTWCRNTQPSCNCVDHETVMKKQSYSVDVNGGQYQRAWPDASKDASKKDESGRTEKEKLLESEPLGLKLDGDPVIGESYDFQEGDFQDTVYEDNTAKVQCISRAGQTLNKGGMQGDEKWN